MNTRAAAGTLSQATQALMVAWQNTKPHWHDVRGRAFEEEYIVEIPARTTQAMESMREIEALLNRLRHDCE